MRPVSPEDGQHRLTEISRHLLNLNSSFQNYHMVLPQASPHHQFHRVSRWDYHTQFIELDASIIAVMMFVYVKLKFKRNSV